MPLTDSDLQQIDTVGKRFVEEMRKGLDQRDADLAEKLKKEYDEKLDAARREWDAEHAKFRLSGLEEAPEFKQFSTSRLIADAMAGKSGTMEMRLCAEAQAKIGKDMSTALDASGGYIVPAQVMADRFIPLLQAQAVAIQAGVVRMDGLSGSPVEIPKLIAGGTASWISETGQFTPSDMTLGQVEMTPHTVVAPTHLSQRLVNLSSPAADQIVQQQLARDLALKIDLAVLNGTGASGQPTGILQTTGINAVTSVGGLAADTAYDKLIDGQHLIYADNAAVGTGSWIMHPNHLRELRQMKDPTDGSQPKARRILSDGPDRLVLGERYFTSTQMPVTDMLYGYFGQAALGQWGTMIIGVDNLRVTGYFKVQVVLAMDVDVGVMQPSSFCAFTGITGAT